MITPSNQITAPLVPSWVCILALTLLALSLACGTSAAPDENGANSDSRGTSVSESQSDGMTRGPVPTDPSPSGRAKAGPAPGTDRGNGRNSVGSRNVPSKRRGLPEAGEPQPGGHPDTDQDHSRRRGHLEHPGSLPPAPGCIRRHHFRGGGPGGPGRTRGHQGAVGVLHWRNQGGQPT